MKGYDISHRKLFIRRREYGYGSMVSFQNAPGIGTSYAGVIFSGRSCTESVEKNIVRIYIGWYRISVIGNAYFITVDVDEGFFKPDSIILPFGVRKTMGNRIGYDILKDCFHGFGGKLEFGPAVYWDFFVLLRIILFFKTEAGVPMCFYKW